MLLPDRVDSVHFAADLVSLVLDSLFKLFHLSRFQLELLLELLVVSLLLLDDRVAFDDFLLALLEFLFHLRDLALVDSIRVGELGALILERRHQTLRLLNQLLLVFDLALERLDEDHLFGQRLLLSVLLLIKRLIALSQLFKLVLCKIKFVLFALKVVLKLLDL